MFNKYSTTDGKITSGGAPSDGGVPAYVESDEGSCSLGLDLVTTSVHDKISPELRDYKFWKQYPGGETHYYYPGTRKHVVVLHDKITHKAWVIDNDKTRLRRMRRDVFTWVGVTLPYVKNDGCTYAMYGLTYAVKGTWGKKDIHKFLRKVKNYFGTNLKGYCWVMETQSRGVEHYHVVICVKKGVHIPKPDDVGWWEKGSSHTTFKAFPYYIAKYLGKDKQHNFDLYPIGSRICGYGYSSEDNRISHRYAMLTSVNKAIVDKSGWQALKYYRQARKDLHDYKCLCMHKSVDEAVKWVSSWSTVYKFKDTILRC